MQLQKIIQFAAYYVTVKWWDHVFIVANILPIIIINTMQLYSGN